MRDRHATYYRSLLLARQGEFLRRPGSVSEVAAERDNLLAAWQWSVDRDHLEAVRTMILGLYWIAEAQGWARALRSLLESRARQFREGGGEAHDDPGRSNERALTWATVLTAILGEWSGPSWETWQTWVAEAESVLAQGAADDEHWRDARWQEVRWMLRFKIALMHWQWGSSESAHLMQALLPELEDGRFVLWPYNNDAQLYWQMQAYRCLGFFAIYHGDQEEAQRLAEQNIVLAERIGAPLLKIEGLYMLASAFLYQDNCERAEEYARRLFQIGRAFGPAGRLPSTIALFYIGLASAGQGDYVRARDCLRRTVAWGRESGIYLILSLHHLGNTELALGNLAQAKRLYQEMISVCEEVGAQYAVVAALTGLARVALVFGKLTEAKQHLLGALKTPVQTRVINHTIDAIAVMAYLRQAEGQWEAAAELCAALLSWPATPHYAPEITQHLRTELAARLERLEAQLSPEVFAAAVARGRARQMEEVVAEFVG